MKKSLPPRTDSAFMNVQIPRFLERFDLSYFDECRCAQYFISRHPAFDVISYSLVLSHDVPGDSLHVSRFYPELFREPDTKYLSAACLYLIVHHFGQIHSLKDNCHITLETRPDIFEHFYARLKDFNFHIWKNGLGPNCVEVVGDYHPSSSFTSVITPREQPSFDF